MRRARVRPHPSHRPALPGRCVRRCARRSCDLPAAALRRPRERNRTAGWSCVCVETVANPLCPGAPVRDAPAVDQTTRLTEGIRRDLVQGSSRGVGWLAWLTSKAHAGVPLGTHTWTWTRDPGLEGTVHDPPTRCRRS